MLRKFATVTRGLLRLNEEGVVAIQMALSLTVLLGLCGLATDFGFAYCKQRQMQTAADAAAFSGAVAMKAGDDYNTEATAVAGQNGFVNGANGVSVGAHNPPVSPPANAADVNSSAIQVIIQQDQPLFLVAVGVFGRVQCRRAGGGDVDAHHQ